MAKFEWHQCQTCGEPIGLLGRFVEWIYSTMGFMFMNHKCKPIDVEHFSIIKYVINHLKLKIWQIKHRMK